MKMLKSNNVWRYLPLLIVTAIIGFGIVQNDRRFFDYALYASLLLSLLIPGNKKGDLVISERKYRYGVVGLLALVTILAFAMGIFWLRIIIAVIIITFHFRFFWKTYIRR